ncbi:hypothetical protein Pcinc_024807 [Petrolisthes cinctipes]|uniref:Uncharacterized protein n=1 Tax=Petrolisthes cinctipes TaxID=88211 RepID=A0AAE1F578_PETCI|nr:hypothetical protein Pcinc_027502 [Petrolisthes cinctipes]KAK3869912.1 hypothetical protein Pcinc_024807 [Petrolisthes cinctipes]
MKTTSTTCLCITRHNIWDDVLQTLTEGVHHLIITWNAWTPPGFKLAPWNEHYHLSSWNGHHQLELTPISLA